MRLINQLKPILFFIFIMGMAENNLPLGQGKKVVEEEQPKVLRAVAPTFITFVFEETGSAEVVIEVKLDHEGKVISAKTVSFSLFKDLSFEDTAKQWVFEKSSAKEERFAHIKFVLRIMPRGTNSSELTTIYRYPTEIEIRSLVFTSQITTFPLPEKEQSQNKKSKP